MRKKELVGFVPGPPLSGYPSELSVEHVAGWNVVLAKAPGVLRPVRRVILKRAQQRQTWLEALMPLGTVIPALPGTRLGLREIPDMLAANADLLEGLATELAGQMQFQITIRCDPDAAMDAMGAQASPFSGIADVAHWQSTFDREVDARLSALPAASLLALPRTDDLVLNTTVLLPAEEQLALEATLEDIDSWWSSGLGIRLIGPSPAVSFASVGLTPVPPRALATAARVLGLPKTTTLDAIRNARQVALRQPHAAVDTIRDAAQLLEQAQALKTPSRFLRAFVWSEGRAASKAPQAVAA